MYYEIFADKYNKAIPIGIVGENKTRRVHFNVEEIRNNFGTDGTFELWVKRCGEKNAYPATMISEVDDCVYWIVSNVDVAIPGNGMCALRLMDEDRIIKSVMYYIDVKESIDSEQSCRPYPDELFADKIHQYAQEAQYASQAIQDMSVESHLSDIPEVEKIVNPETGEVTLDFGLPPAGADIPETEELLKGDGNGGVVSAISGIDYLEPNALDDYQTQYIDDEGHYYGDNPTVESALQQVGRSLNGVLNRINNL